MNILTQKKKKKNLFETLNQNKSPSAVLLKLYKFWTTKAKAYMKTNLIVVIGCR